MTKSHFCRDRRVVPAMHFKGTPTFSQWRRRPFWPCAQHSLELSNEVSGGCNGYCFSFGLGLRFLRKRHSEPAFLELSLDGVHIDLTTRKSNRPLERTERTLGSIIVSILVFVLFFFLAFNDQGVARQRQVDILLIHAGEFDCHTIFLIGLPNIDVRHERCRPA